MKSREEVQTGVESFELAIQLFDSLGFKPVFRYQKFREVWRISDVESSSTALPSATTSRSKARST